MAARIKDVIQINMGKGKKNQKFNERYYHITHIENEQSILEQGIEQRTEGVYVTTSKQAAISYGKSILKGECVLFFCGKKLAKHIAKDISPVDVISTVKGYEFMIQTDRPIPFKVDSYHTCDGIRPYEKWENRMKKGHIVVMEDEETGELREVCQRDEPDRPWL